MLYSSCSKPLSPACNILWEKDDSTYILRKKKTGESFNRLRRHQRWRRGSSESDEAWNQYQKALKVEFQL